MSVGVIVAVAVTMVVAVVVAVADGVRMGRCEGGKVGNGPSVMPGVTGTPVAVENGASACTPPTIVVAVPLTIRILNIMATSTDRR